MRRSLVNTTLSQFSPRFDPEQTNKRFENTFQGPLAKFHQYERSMDDRSSEWFLSVWYFMVFHLFVVSFFSPWLPSRVHSYYFSVRGFFCLCKSPSVPPAVSLISQLFSWWLDLKISAGLRFVFLPQYPGSHFVAFCLVWPFTLDTASLCCAWIEWMCNHSPLTHSLIQVTSLTLTFHLFNTISQLWQRRMTKM